MRDAPTGCSEPLAHSAPVVSNNYSYGKMKMRIKVEASAGLSDTLISIGRPFSR